MTSEHLIRLINRIYPAAYRAERGEEILSTVRDSLSTARRGTAALEVADLAGHALRERTRLTATSRPGAVAATAAPLAAGSAIALSLVFLVFAEPAWAPDPNVNPHIWHKFGPFATLGPLTYLAWLTVFLAALAGRRSAARLLTAMAMTLSAAIIPLAHFTGIERSPSYMLGALALFGLIVLAAPTDPMRRSPLDRRVLTAWTLLMTAILSGITLEYGRPLWYRGNDSIIAMGDLMAYALGLLLLVSVLCLRLNRRLPFAAITVTFPWAIFIYGTSTQIPGLLVAVLCAAGLAALVLLLPMIDTQHRTDSTAMVRNDESD